MKPPRPLPPDASRATGAAAPTTPPDLPALRAALADAEAAVLALEADLNTSEWAAVSVFLW